jgi:hypothetical protein
MSFASSFAAMQELKDRRRQRADDEALGNSLYSLFRDEFEQRNKAGLAPYQTKVDNFVAGMDANAAPNLEAVIGAAFGGDDAEKAAVSSAGRQLVNTGQGLNNDLSLAQLVYGSNPLDALKGMGGRQILRALPTFLQMDQNRIAQLKSDRADQRAQTAMDEFNAATTPEARKAAALKYQFATGKTIDSHFYTPQTKEVSQGATLIDTTTGKPIYTAPTKPQDKYKGAAWGTFDPQTGQPVWQKPAAEKTSQAKINENKSYFVAHNQWVKNNATKLLAGQLTEQDSPYWGKVMSALEGGEQPTGQPAAPAASGNKPPEYMAIMSDIANSTTMEERQAKFERHKAKLKEFEAQGVDVANDLDYLKNN